MADFKFRIVNAYLYKYNNIEYQKSNKYSSTHMDILSLRFGGIWTKRIDVT